MAVCDEGNIVWFVANSRRPTRPWQRRRPESQCPICLGFALYVALVYAACFLAAWFW